MNGFQIHIKDAAAIIKADLLTGSSQSSPAFTGVAIDSRQMTPGYCFFAIAGPNHDGHHYIQQAFEAGAACAVVSADFYKNLDSAAIDGQALLVVKDTVTALGDLAAEYRRRNPFKVIAVTGSVGKTTTRQMIAHVLSTKFKCHQSPSNFNNHIGLPLTLLSAPPETEIVVAELASSAPDEIAPLSQIAAPDYALVTNTGFAHMQGFGDFGTVITEKLSIRRGLSQPANLFVNADCRPLIDVCRKSDIPCVTFGTDNNAEISVTRHDTDKTICLIQDKPLHLASAGSGWIENIAAAWAICSRLGIAADEFAESMTSFAPIEMRGQTLHLNGLTVINDCYNANPASMTNALELLNALVPDGRRKVFICGEMAELGRYSEQMHHQLGIEAADQGIDLLIAVGYHASTTLLSYSAHSTSGRACRFDSAKDLCDNLRQLLRTDDIVLVKGSRTNKLEQVVDKLTKQFGPRKSTQQPGGRNP